MEEKEEIERKRKGFFEYLPTSYQRGSDGKDNELLRDFLKGFEDIFLGYAKEAGEGAEKGLTEVLNRVEDYFDPSRTPFEFVEWLTGWVALDLQNEIDESEFNEAFDKEKEPARQRFPSPEKVRGRKRRLLKKLAPIYHLRGTKEGLRQILDIYFGEELRGFNVNELIKPFQVGDPEGLQRVRDDYERRTGNKADSNTSINDLLSKGNYDALGSVVGRSTVVGEAAAYFFIVYAERLLPCSYIEGRDLKRRMSEIVDFEKPAHTYYAMKLRAPGMRVGVRDWCDIGESTLIGGFEI